MEIDFEEIQDESSEVDPTPTQNQDESSSTAIPPQQTENGGGEKVYHLIG